MTLPFLKMPCLLYSQLQRAKKPLSIGHPAQIHKIQTSLTKQASGLQYLKNNALKSALFHFHNPAVMTQFFSLYRAIALFYLSENITRFSEQSRMKSPVHFMQSKRTGFTLLLAKK